MCTWEAAAEVAEVAEVAAVAAVPVVSGPVAGLRPAA